MVWQSDGHREIKIFESHIEMTIILQFGKQDYHLSLMNVSHSASQTLPEGLPFHNETQET